jgi:hypothetical protein
LLYVGIGVFEPLLENGVHRIAEYAAFGLQRVQEGLLKICSGDVTPNEAVDEIDI